MCTKRKTNFNNLVKDILNSW